MIGLGLLVAGFVLVLLAGNALDDDRAPQSKSETRAPGALDALLFALCLVATLAKRARDAEDDDF